MAISAKSSGVLALLAAGLLVAFPNVAKAADTVDAVTDPLPKEDPVTDGLDTSTDLALGGEDVIDQPLPEDVPIEWVIRGGEPDVMYMAFGAGGMDLEDAATQVAEAAADQAIDRLQNADTAPSKLP